MSTINGPLNPSTRLLCSFLRETKGGFAGLLAMAARPNQALEKWLKEPVDEARERAERGRRLYPELRYLCALLRTRTRPW
jgi:hypothetical protein